LPSIERHFFPVKVFTSLSHADSSFVGESDISCLKLYHTYVLLVHPAQGHMLDMYQRSDQGWTSNELGWSVAT
jgi:hypothetical protein